MRRYLIHHRIKTKAKVTTPFEIEGYKFEHESFTQEEGYTGNYCIVSKECSADSWVDAINNFRHNLARISPRIAFVSQCALQFLLEPFFVYNMEYNREIILIRYSREVEASGLSFRQQEIDDLQKVSISSIDDSFYNLMMESNNASTAYTRLYMLFSAIENLAQTKRKIKCQNCELEREVDSAAPDTIKKILGGRLYGKCWGHNGLRHQISHGRFPIFKGELIEEIYKSIIKYVNKELGTSLHEDIKNPQRSFTPGMKSGMNFYKLPSGYSEETLSIKDFLEVLDKDLCGREGNIEFTAPNEHKYKY